MVDTWNINGKDAELTAAERETLLHLDRVGGMQTTTDIKNACDSIGYRRKALRALDSLQEIGLIRVHQPDSREDYENLLHPPKHVMLSKAGEQFVDEHEAELATADMDRDELREEVYRLRETLRETEQEYEERLQAVEDQIEDVEWESIHGVRADLEQVEERVRTVEAKMAEKVDREEFTRSLKQAKHGLEDSIETVRVDVNENVRELNARVGDLEAAVGVIEEKIDELDNWKAQVDWAMENDIEPWIDYLYDNAESIQRVLGTSDEDGDYNLTDGLRRRVFGQ